MGTGTSEALPLAPTLKRSGLSSARPDSAADRTPRAARGATPVTDQSLPVRHPSPEMWGAILAGARRRRAPHLWPALQRPTVKDHSVIDAPVRAYVLPEDERTRLLTSATREAR